MRGDAAFATEIARSALLSSISLASEYVLRESLISPSKADLSEEGAVDCKEAVTAFNPFFT